MANPKRLTRDTDNAILGGVCSGIANYFSVDPVLVRLIAIVLACTGGGIVAYIIGWIIVPPKNSVQS